MTTISRRVPRATLNAVTERLMATARRRRKHGVFTYFGTRVARENSGADLDRRVLAHGEPDLLHRRVGDADAAVRPVLADVACIWPDHTVRHAVNHDVAAGIDPQLVGARDVVCVRIGQAHGKIVVTVEVLEVDVVFAFRRARVARALLRSKGMSAECNVELAYDVIGADQDELALRLLDDDTLGGRPVQLVNRGPGRVGDGAIPEQHAGEEQDERSCRMHHFQFATTNSRVAITRGVNTLT